MKQPFHIELPDDWEDQSVYAYQGPEEDGIPHRLVLTIDREGVPRDVVDYARPRLEAAAAALPSSETLLEEPFEHPSGADAYMAVIRWYDPQGRARVQKYYYLVADRVGYTFSATFSKRTLKTIGRQVDAIVESFRPGETE